MTAVARNPYRRLFPESNVVRFNRRSDRFLFYSIINELVRPDHVVLDFGAGRNRLSDYGPHISRLANFRGKCRKVIGLDVDPIVETNDTLDEAKIIELGKPLPLEDESVDVIVSNAVFEHIEDPQWAAGELGRVLKPGGWICAFTPNKWGYVGLGARLVPNKLHAGLLTVIQPNSRQAKDVFPVLYKMNTVGAISRFFPKSKFENFSFCYNSEPSYNFGSEIMARFWLLYMALTPRAFGKCLVVMVRKR